MCAQGYRSLSLSLSLCISVSLSVCVRVYMCVCVCVRALRVCVCVCIHRVCAQRYWSGYGTILPSLGRTRYVHIHTHTHTHTEEWLHLLGDVATAGCKVLLCSVIHARARTHTHTHTQTHRDGCTCWGTLPQRGARPSCFQSCLPLARA